MESKCPGRFRRVIAIRRPRHYYSIEFNRRAYKLFETINNTVFIVTLRSYFIHWPLVLYCSITPVMIFRCDHLKYDFVFVVTGKTVIGRDQYQCHIANSIRYGYVYPGWNIYFKLTSTVVILPSSVDTISVFRRIIFFIDCNIATIM